MTFPNSATDTGKYILGVRVFTDDFLPNCNRCLVMSGHHGKTKETGWYAFCNKSGKQMHVGPYQTYHEALKVLTLTKGCNECEFNKSANKSAYLSVLDEKLKEDMIKLYGSNTQLSVYLRPVQFFVESRNYLDINFKNRFGVRFFASLPDDTVAVGDFIKPCQNRNDFALKIQALAGMIDRINECEVRNLIKDKEIQKLGGSVNILEQILKENFPNYPRHIISNLRSLMSLRSKMYPTHATASEIIVVLGNFGIGQYPLDNWEKGWKKILNLCTNSLADLVKILQ